MISQLKIIVTLYINRFLYLWVKTPVHSSVITVKINKWLYSKQLKTCCVVGRVSKECPCSCFSVPVARHWIGWEKCLSAGTVSAQSTAPGSLSELGSSCGFVSRGEGQLRISSEKEDCQKKVASMTLRSSALRSKWDCKESVSSAECSRCRNLGLFLSTWAKQLGHQDGLWHRKISVTWVGSCTVNQKTQK